MARRTLRFAMLLSIVLVVFAFLLPSAVYAQGVTTASLAGMVTSSAGESLPGANVVAVHEPTGTRYGASVRSTGQYNISNMKIGGPYTVTASIVGYKGESSRDVYLNIGQELRVDFRLVEEAIEGREVVVTAERDDVLNSGRTGAATYVDRDAVRELPSVKRSTRDLTRLDPRSDGNFSFGGRNWLYNNISLDGSYFNNPFGLDDPAPGGQTNAEPVPFDAVDQVQVSVAPFDVREGGFTGAGINTVTKSGTNTFKASVYSFLRNESLLGNKVRGSEVVANPDLSFNQSGVSVGGPLVENKLFFFLNAELERRDDPGTNFVADRGQGGSGVSRVRASVMDSIRQRMRTYGYDTGPYEGYVNETNNEKLLLKLDWNAHENHNVTFRYNQLNARRDLPPHPFVLSPGGRGPNASSLPFQNSGYKINNKLNSFALEVNSRFEVLSNRFFASYNRFRDNRDAKSSPFPTIDIAEGGVTYTTLGHEPFSIHNILDQDVLQFTNNVSFYQGNHVITAGATYELFNFFNSFNIFRHGVFFLPYGLFPGTSRFSSLNEFFTSTHPDSANRADFRSFIGTGPFKGEKISVGQLAFYAQDQFVVSDQFNLIYGVRVDLPIYNTKPVANPFSTSLTLLDESGNRETVDQAKLPGAKLLFSPRVGFNWDVEGNRSTQIRGGTGIFTGRVPFVWVGNVISNPGTNPNLFPAPGGQQISTSDDAILQQSFDLNGMDPDFKWPQVWSSNLAIDYQLPGGLLGTLEFVYGKDINAIFVRNADLKPAVRTLPDGRPYYGGAGNNELNAPFPGAGDGVYVIDNISEGYNFSAAVQLRKRFDFGLNASLGYAYLLAKNNMQSTEIASVLWQGNPVQGNPNKPELGFSQFGIRNRITASASYRIPWSEQWATSIGLFLEVAEGNRFSGAGGNRYSFTYAGDVNGDGQGGNDLIYIPSNQNEIVFVPNGTITPAQQWTAFNAFIEQDDYLKENRGKIAERNGGINPWFANVDLKLLQDFIVPLGGQSHTFQLSVDILNVLNLLNSDWGIRQVASPLATSPLQFKGFDTQGRPTFNFDPTITKTFIDDPGLDSRWQMQIGLRYLLN